MTLSEAKSLYRQLVDTVQKFKSPAFRYYFSKKANEDYYSLGKDLKKGKYNCVIKKYLEEQKDMLDIMKRQTVIYNMFYDKDSNI